MWTADEKLYQKQIQEEADSFNYLELKEIPRTSEELVKMLQDDDLWTFGETVPDSYTPKKMMNSTGLYIGRLQDNAETEWKVLRKKNQQMANVRKTQASEELPEKLPLNPWTNEPFESVESWTKFCDNEWRISCQLSAANQIYRHQLYTVLTPLLNEAVKQEEAIEIAVSLSSYLNAPEFRNSPSKFGIALADILHRELSCRVDSLILDLHHLIKKNKIIAERVTALTNDQTQAPFNRVCCDDVNFADEGCSKVEKLPKDSVITLLMSTQHFTCREIIPHLQRCLRRALIALEFLHNDRSMQQELCNIPKLPEKWDCLNYCVALICFAHTTPHTRLMKCRMALDYMWIYRNEKLIGSE
jgi:hypothetical protein